MTTQHEPALPLGTQVVLRTPGQDLDGHPVQAGATGRVRDQDGGRYRVELPDGRLVSCVRGDVDLRRRRRRQARVALGDAARNGHQLVEERTVYAAVVGSRAFGLDVDDSDTDVRG